MGAEELVIFLTPIIVLLVTMLVKVVKPLIPGWLLLTVVTLLSGLLTFISELLIAPENTWLIQFLLGMLAVVIDQFIKQFGESKRKLDHSRMISAKL